jgi:ADP-ribosylglycohydrolase
MFFLKNPYSIDSLYEVINAGGDADSNGSMVAALLGALNGPFIFPSHLVHGLNQIQFNEVLSVADEFTEVLGG